jgi:hypothetical protein
MDAEYRRRAQAQPGTKRSALRAFHVQRTEARPNWLLWAAAISRVFVFGTSIVAILLAVIMLLVALL